MKNFKRVKGQFMASLLILVIVLGSWVGNLYKLTDCDFEAPYKCEVLHGIGIVPVISLITVWFDTDSSS